MQFCSCTPDSHLSENQEQLEVLGQYRRAHAAVAGNVTGGWCNYSILMVNSNGLDADVETELNIRGINIRHGRFQQQLDGINMKSTINQQLLCHIFLSIYLVATRNQLASIDHGGDDQRG